MGVKLAVGLINFVTWRRLELQIDGFVVAGASKRVRQLTEFMTSSGDVARI